MRLIITGGGTGGHVYPALEVGLAARDKGADVAYFGSLRGMEREAAARAGVAFRGFPSEPLLGIKSLAGLRSRVQMLRAIGMAVLAVRKHRPDYVFSTGGYGAVPVVFAARLLKVPFGIHEANSLPGRSNRAFARSARAFTCTFRSTPSFLPEVKVRRTGHPIREGLRRPPNPSHQTVLVMGGSQGSRFLNDVVYEVARARPNLRIVHSVGKGDFERMRSRSLSQGHEIHAYLDAAEIAKAYGEASLVIGRSGSSLAEFAATRAPSILVPLPTSADHHQYYNAREFAEMGAADIFWQPDSAAAPVSGVPTATATAVAEAIDAWVENPSRVEKARHNLEDWDRPDATRDIVAGIWGA